MSRNSKARSTGFTLIELMVVVFIIGILVAATLTIIPKVQRAVYGAQTSAQLSAIANAIQQYYNDYKAYPGPLPNNQICWAYDSVTANEPAVYYTAANAITQYPGATQYPLGSLQPFTTGSPYNPPLTGTYNNVTGAQNLVLGLLGGLELQTAVVANVLSVTGFAYNPQDIFSDGITPAPKGAASLNFSNPRRGQPYIQVKAGDLSTPNNTYYGGAGASFVDSSGDLSATDKRSPQDAMIPVFLDKYSDPLPILYYRTNVAGTAIVGYRNRTLPNGGTTLTDPTITTGAPDQIAQYDLLQNLPYTSSRMGTKGDGSSAGSTYHGLGAGGITASGNTNQLLISSSTPATPSVDTIDYNSNGTYLPSNGTASTGGQNALAYFKDPTLNSNSYDGITGNTHLGIARQKDGFVLISAGPDRLYGTHDDVIYPGPLVPPSN